MTRDEFISATIGKPWINRADGPDSYDCWGLIVDYFRKVRGIDLDVYTSSDITEGFIQEIESDKWRECDGGVVFMAFKDGKPAHCGLVFGTKVLHASGWNNNQGQVTLHQLSRIKRIFKDLRVYEYY
jgi:cell wall-associated NlpC family hydrolase